MCFIDSGLWCRDTTTQAASDDTLFQRRGWRGVLSFSFEVGVRQGRVTWPCKSLPGVRSPNMSSPLRSVRPEYSMSIIQSIFHLKLNIVGEKPPAFACPPMENLSYVTRPLSGPASPGSLYEIFPPLPGRSSYLRVAPTYFRPPRSLSILQNTEALSSVYSFLEPFACRK